MNHAHPNFDSLLDDSRFLRDETPADEDRRADADAYDAWLQTEEGQRWTEMDEADEALFSALLEKPT